MHGIISLINRVPDADGGEIAGSRLKSYILREQTLRSMAADDFWVALPPVENLEGGGSRTRHVILKRRHASLSQSVFSCRIGEKTAPNRDYPYEGLYVLAGGDYRKFIDTVAFGVRAGDEWLALAPEAVRASPWE